MEYLHYVHYTFYGMCVCCATSSMDRSSILRTLYTMYSRTYIYIFPQPLDSPPVGPHSHSLLTTLHVRYVNSAPPEHTFKYYTPLLRTSIFCSSSCSCSSCAIYVLPAPFVFSSASSSAPSSCYTNNRLLCCSQ